MERRKTWGKKIKAKSSSALTNSSWKVNTGFGEVGCSEIIVNQDKIQDMCYPSGHFIVD